MTQNSINQALIILVLTCSCYVGTTAQSTFGREFYIGILKPYHNKIHEYVTLVITSSKLTNGDGGDVHVIVPYLGQNTTRSFTNSREIEVSVSNSVIQVNNRVEHRGIQVKSSIDVSVLVVTSLYANYPDARESFLALPSHVISTSYVISSYAAGTWYSEFLIVATMDNTTIKITNSRINSLGTPQHMDKLDSYLLSSTQDLSGSIVTSDKPVAVFSGHEAAGVACHYNHYLVEQLLPTKMFGNEYIVPPLPPKTAYEVRVYGSEPNTTMNYTFSSRKKGSNLTGSGSYHEINGNNEPVIIFSNKPVQVMLYSTCFNQGPKSLGGSTMSIVPSTDQYSRVYQFTTPSFITVSNNYLALMAKDRNIKDGFRIDGQQMQVSHEYNVTTPSHSYFVYIYQITSGFHRLEHVNGLKFGALVYGFGNTTQDAYSNIIGLNIAGPACEQLSTPSNGRVIVLHNSTDHLQLATYTCEPGYLLQGAFTRTCSSSGQWSGVMPTCEAKDCGNLVSPDHGHIRTPNGTKFGNHADYVCNHGYSLTGQMTRVCQSSGQWSGVNSTCDPIDSGLTCLQCSDVYHPNLCNTVTTCQQGQVCFVEKFTTHNEEIRYNSGCSESKHCNAGSQIFGKRSANCFQCCTTDLCNLGGCGSPGLPTRDQRGPLCYDCAFTYNMSECRTINLCKPNEVCSIEKYDWGGLYDQYTTECKASHCLQPSRMSSQSGKMTRSTPVCHNCCAGDLCNSNCNTTSQSSNGVSIVG